jgi:ABC-2 type transport system ATP-binding protein
LTDAIRTAGLGKRYRGWYERRAERDAVSGLDFHVPAGGITGLLGPNGAGKSTVIKLLLGLVRPTTGSAAVLGRDVSRESLAIRREIGFVPESRSVFGWMRVGALMGHVAALSPRWDAALADRLETRWAIDRRMRLRELSLGTRSRLLLLVALARRAKLLLLDEPTTGLDPALVDDALSELAGAAADGTTVLLVTHRLDEVDRICDRVMMMREGRAVLSADLDDLRATWRAIDVRGHPAPERLRRWAEVAAVMPHGEHTRLLVRTDPDGVVARVRLLGADVTGVRALSLREIYLTCTQEGGLDAARDDLA